MTPRAPSCRPTRCASGSRAVCPPGIEIQSCTIVRLAGHPLFVKLQPGAGGERPALGLGKLIDAVDLVIRPAPDGMRSTPRGCHGSAPR